MSITSDSEFSSETEKDGVCFTPSPVKEKVFEELNKYLVPDISNLIMCMYGGFCGETKEITIKKGVFENVLPIGNGNLVHCCPCVEDLTFIRPNGEIIKKYILKDRGRRRIVLLENGDLVAISTNGAVYEFHIYNTDTCELISECISPVNKSSFIVIENMLLSIRANSLINPYTGRMTRLSIYNTNIFEGIYPFRSGLVSYNKKSIFLIENKSDKIVDHDIEAFVRPKKDGDVLHYLTYRENKYYLEYYNIMTKTERRINLEIDKDGPCQIFTFNVADKILLFLSNIVVIFKTLDNTFIKGKLPTPNSIQLLNNLGDSVVICSEKDQLSSLMRLDMDTGVFTELGKINSKYKCTTSDNGYVFAKKEILTIVR